MKGLSAVRGDARRFEVSQLRIPVAGYARPGWRRTERSGTSITTLIGSASVI